MNKTASAESTILLSDNFDRADSAVVDGWFEVEQTGATISIANFNTNGDGKLFFDTTSNFNARPVVSRIFTVTSTGILHWDFDFNWTKTGDDLSAELWMQLGDSTQMMDPITDPGRSLGVGVDLRWGTNGGFPQRLLVRQNGGGFGGILPLVDIFSGPHHLTVTVDLANGTYSVAVDGAVVGSNLAFDDSSNVTKLDTVRFFTRNMFEQAYSERTIDNVIVSTSPVANTAPAANAGTDQAVTDANDDRSEDVTLDGSGSMDADGDSLTYSWAEGGSVIATGVSPTVSFSVGIHTVTLAVTDDYGASDTDDVVISVSPPALADPAVQMGSPSSPNTAFTSDPVNVVFGNFVFQRQDLGVPSRGFPTLLHRTYNSAASQTDGPQGFGWTHSFNVEVIPNSATSVLVRNEDGRLDDFTALGGGAFAPPQGIYNELTQDTSGNYTLTRKDKRRFLFDATGNLLSVSDGNGNTQTLTYDQVGNLIQISDTTGRVFTLSYDANNRITGLADPAARTYNYEYDLTGNLVVSRDAAGNATSYVYDLFHRLVSITEPLGNVVVTNLYDSQDRVFQQTDALGNISTIAYGTNQTIFTDARGNSTKYDYDSQFRITSITDPLGGTLVQTYDSSGNLVQVTDKRGNSTQLNYDGRGNVTSITDSLSGVTSLDYDSDNNLLSRTDALGRLSTFDYDAVSNLIGSTDALGSVNTFVYDAFGQVISSGDSKLNITSFSFDSNGNLRVVNDPLTHAITFSYDGVSRLIAQTDALNHTAVFNYDVLNRVISTLDPLGNPTTITYDANGNKLSQTDANLNTTSFRYDAINRLVEVTDAEGGTAKYAYDAAGNRASVTDGNNHTTSYGYDAFNRLTIVTDPLGRITRYAYDAAGNRTLKTNAQGHSTTYTYDAIGRLVRVDYADGTFVQYTYDAVGNRLSMVDKTGVTTYTLDALNRLKEVIYPTGQTVGYTYDSVGNRSSLTYPDGSVVTYAYDQANRLASATDWLGNITSYRYDEANRLQTTTHANGVVEKNTFDIANRLLGITSLNQKGKEIATTNYALDAVGNRTSSIDRHGHITGYTYDNLYRLVGVQPHDGKNTSYEYDAVGNRLRLSMASDYTLDFSYDVADQLILAGDTSFSFDANGSQTGCGDDIFAYDEENRLVRAEVGLGEASCRDLAKELDLNSEHDGDEGSVSTYLYNGDGMRVSQMVTSMIHNEDEGETKGNQTTTYIWDVAAGLPVIIDDGENRYVYGLNLIHSVDIKDKVSGYLHDGLGSVVAMIAGKGSGSNPLKNDAFGARVGGVKAPGSFGFTGQQHDNATGLIYLRARHYDPITGRFMSRDRFPTNESATQSINRYTYGFNNPVNMTDPSGLVPTSPGGWDWQGDIAGLVFGKAGTFATWSILEGASRTAGDLTPYARSLSEIRRVEGSLSTWVTAVSILQAGSQELFIERGITPSQLGSAVWELPENVVFAWRNPDAAIEASIDGLSSTSAVIWNATFASQIRVISFITTGSVLDLETTGLQLRESIIEPIGSNSILDPIGRGLNTLLSWRP